MASDQYPLKNRQKSNKTIDVIKNNSLLLVPFSIGFLIHLFFILGWTYILLGLFQAKIIDIFPSGHLGIIFVYIVAFIIAFLINLCALLINIKMKNKIVFWIAYCTLTILLALITSRLLGELFAAM
jgi:hypothetical protein